jgi:hypothetical protein
MRAVFNFIAVITYIAAAEYKFTAIITNTGATIQPDLYQLYPPQNANATTSEYLSSVGINQMYRMGDELF